jgi:GNAT superfamily N-acetyltransferase
LPAAVFGGSDATVLTGQMSEDDWWQQVRHRLGISPAALSSLRADIGARLCWDERLLACLGRVGDRDAPDGWAFLYARGFEPTGEMADLIADVARFRAPGWVLSRAVGDVRFELAAHGDAAQVIALQERHFPDWTAFYEHQLTLPGTVLVARVDGQIVGTCTVEGPAEYDFLWPALVRGAVGAFGCVGVDSAARRHGIGLAMVARACELLAARGAEVCYCAYTYLEDWYAQLGFTRWRRYTMASASLR